MPLKDMLAENGDFDSKSVAVLLEAYREVVAELGLLAPMEKERAARLVIRLATGQTDLDVVKLRNRVADSMLNEGRADHLA